jgi:hypothetical protein
MYMWIATDKKPECKPSKMGEQDNRKRIGAQWSVHLESLPDDDKALVFELNF